MTHGLFKQGTAGPLSGTDPLTDLPYQTEADALTAQVTQEAYREYLARQEVQLPAQAPPPPPEKQPWHQRRAVPLITGHRLLVVLTMTAASLALFRLQLAFWPGGSSPRGIGPDMWNWGTLTWLGAVIPGAAGLAGMLIFRKPEGLNQVRPVPQLVSWRIVSRGMNIRMVTETIRRCQAEMAQTPLFPYIIEVITDTPTELAIKDDDVRHLVVPAGYETSNGSLFKARGLQYALENSPLPQDAWIVHLDEETQPTASGIQGIARMIMEEEESGQYRIGQGAILYHRAWRRHPFLTLADMVRTGDDFARFHLGHRVGITLFGLHGSFIVVKNRVEKATGFDFGPQGSITEDAFWALVSMEAGYRCRWVDGYLEEQSTESVMDFVKQRRRWYQGLAKVAIHAPVKLRWRLVIGTNTILWTLAPFAVLYTAAHFAYGSSVMAPVKLMADLSMASFLTLYVCGLRENLREHGITSPVQRAAWYALQVMLLPVFCTLEAAGVMLAIVHPVKGFHVVSKDGK